MSETRLIRIDHKRCDDWGYDTSYVLAPVAWTEDQIEDALDAAQKAYLADYKIALTLPKEKDAPKRVSENPNYDSYDPDLTVSEIKELHAEKYAEWTKYNETAGGLKKSFEDYLEGEGFLPIYNADSFKVDWGHAHGSNYQYGMEPNKNSVQSPFVVATGAEPDEFLGW